MGEGARGRGGDFCEGARGEGARGRHPEHLFTFSAKTQAALQALASRYLSYLEQHPDISLADLCFTANTGRSHFAHRYALVADSSEQLREQLAAIVAGRESVGVLTRHASMAQHLDAGKRPTQRIAFLFTGQGSQYVDMGRQLYETEPTFRAVIERCDDILRATEYLSHSLLEVLYPTHQPTNPPTHQPTNPPTHQPTNPSPTSLIKPLTRNPLSLRSNMPLSSCGSLGALSHSLL